MTVQQLSLMDVMELILCGLIFLVGDVLGKESRHRNVTHFRDAFDKELYARVLDEEKCMRQLWILSNHTLGLRFLDASAKIPSGVMVGNHNDLGDYFECLGINQLINEVDIQGKYCVVNVPVVQDLLVSRSSPAWSDVANLLTLTGLPGNNLVDLAEAISSETKARLKNYANAITGFRHKVNSSGILNTALNPDSVVLGICIPHACTTEQVVDYVITKNMRVLDLTYSEFYCRLPNDKPFMTGDYVAVIVFCIIAVITIMSTSYDIYNQLILKRGQSQLNNLYQSFSVYTNTRRLLTFNKMPGELECVEGIRTISMLWVVAGHSYSYPVYSHLHNTKYVLEWSRRFSTTWLNAAPVTVDTFFLLSGMLSVYNTVGKFNRGRFLKNIHLYYLLRFLRMFPLLAAVVLFEASLYQHASDGPIWTTVAGSSEFCKHFWWTTLLHIQNHFNPAEMCLGQSWYLAVDMQLHLLSPLIIVWMFNQKYVAWFFLIVALILSLVASSIYSFTYHFGAVIGNPAHFADFYDYMDKYYTNTLTRASPFVIGMVVGYLLHLYRDKRIYISKVNVVLLWTLSLLIVILCVVSHYPVMQVDHDLQIYEDILNAYMRTVWAGAIGFVIFACVKGYGGPINWFLSLHMWKLPARISYGVYLLHIQIVMIMQGSWVKSYYFTDQENFYRFISNATLSFIISFFLTILIDSPCSTLLKLFITGKTKPETTMTSKPDTEKNNSEHKYYKTSL